MPRLFLLALLLAGVAPAMAASLPKAPEIPDGLPWLNVTRPLTLGDLAGKVVILDFWTYGCVNCLHVAAELKPLEEEFGNRLAVIGVHTPKFDNERNLDTLRRNILRYDLRHPVIQDEQGLLMEAYGAMAWPTLAVIDPRGRFVARLVGEGKGERLAQLIGQLLELHEGRIDDSPLPLALEQNRPSAAGLAGPGKVAAAGDRVAISDTLHHRVVIADMRGQVLRVVGDGIAGLVDGDGDLARFNAPQGLAIHDGVLFVADAGNHAVRRVDLDTGEVFTIAGTGRLGRGGSPRSDTIALAVDLRSPWDLVADGQSLYIAMAGIHQIWRLDLSTGRIGVFAGSGREGLVDGGADEARFSQPSGLALTGRNLVVADAEASAVRLVNLESGDVHTLVGTGLFDFGDVDGPLDDARLQHPSAVVALDGDSLLVADTYNHKLKGLDLSPGLVVTLAGSGAPGKGGAGAPYGLNEPSGLALLDDAVLVADTNNDRLLRFDPVSGRLEPWPLQWQTGP